MYRLTLTDDDCNTIRFVGGRYEWSNALLAEGLGIPGEHEIPEHVAWSLNEAFEADTEGGHSYFPMLDSRSDLAHKLYTFMDAIV